MVAGVTAGMTQMSLCQPAGTKHHVQAHHIDKTNQVDCGEGMTRHIKYSFSLFFFISCRYGTKEWVIKPKKYSEKRRPVVYKYRAHNREE